MKSLFHRSSRRSPTAQVSFVHLIGKDPYVDWTLITFVFSLATLAAISAGALVYLDVQSRLESPSSRHVSSDASARFDANALYGVISGFDARAAERVLLSRGYAGPSDPSLP